MVSKLSRRIDEFDLRVRQLDGAESDMPYKIVLELTGIVRELSRKLDQQEEVSVYNL